MPVRANPAGGNVAAGSATIAGAGHTLTVNQSSNRAIINWNSFSIDAGETTRFVQPSSKAAILNRVTGADPSSLLGHLTSNGQVYLLNPNGIVIGPNGKIDTAAFVASTLNLSDGAFLQGDAMKFAGASGAGIRVLGTVSATNGDVVLVAVAVDNRGRITAPNGQAILAAGGEVLYLPDGQSDIVVKAPSAAAANVNNSGIVAAASVQLKAAGSAYALAVNNSGQISATAVRQVGGRVLLDGGDGNTATSGTVTARSGEIGGAVAITGKQVALGANSVVDVSAPSGGGTVMIGGGRHGADPTIANARDTNIDAGAIIRANATSKGNGGSVTAWSDGTTNFSGTIQSQGGPNGGNGGNAEVSGGALAFKGTVDLSAPQGTHGNLLLDPLAIDIDAATASAIQTALLTSSDTIEADDSITVSSAITSASTSMLELQAPTIAVNADISLNGTLRFDDTTGNGLSVTSSPEAAITAHHVTTVGHFDVTDLAGPVTTPLWDFSIAGTLHSITADNPSNAIDKLDFLTPGAALTGDLNVVNKSAMELIGRVTTPGAITIAAAGNLTIDPGTVLTADGTTKLASTDGAFINNAGATLLAGTGRKLIYTATDAGGFTDGGLGYTQYNPVSYGEDPEGGLASVTYIKNASLLPLLTITAGDASRLYGASDPSFVSTLSGGTSADLATAVQYQIANGPAVNVGSYAIVPFGAVSSTRRLAFADGTLTVNPAPLFVVADSGSRLYGSANPVLSASYHGLKNGDTSSVVTGLTIATTATSASDVGNYSVDVSGGSAANYTITDIDGTLTVLPAPLTIIANDATRFTDAGDPAFSASYSGLVNGDDPSTFLSVSFITNATLLSPSGAYTIFPVGAGIGSKAADYTVTFVNGRLDVVSRPVPIVQTATFTSSVIPTVMQDIDTEPTTTVTTLTDNLNLDVGPINLGSDKVLICTTGCLSLGGAAQGELDNVIDAYAQSLGSLTNPPITADGIKAALVDPKQSATVMGYLLPYIYSDLSSILSEDPSKWSPQQAAFVTAVQGYIQAQRLAAAQQATADYQAWAQKTQADTTAQINAMPATAQAAFMGVLSSNPPVPPNSLLQTVNAGLSMNNGQLGAYSALTATAAGDGSGYAAGGASDAGRITTLLAEGAGLTPASSDLSKLSPALKTILPKAESTTARVLAKANKTLEAAEAIGDVSEAAEATKTIAAINKGLGAAEAIPVVGEIVEVVGNVMQAGIAIDQYAQISDFNKAFSSAVNAAGQPVSVSDLKQMMSSGAGQQQMFTYLTAMAATNGSPPAVTKPTMSLTGITTLAGQL